MQPQLWTINGLSVELKMDGRTLEKRLDGLEPDVIEGRSKKYKMAKVFQYLNDRTTITPAEEKARYDKLRADKVELELDQAKGHLLSAEDVVDTIGRYLSDLKTNILSIPTKAAPMLLGCKTLAQVKGKLDDFIYDSLEEISNLKPSDYAGHTVGEAQATAKTDDKRVGGSEKKVKP